MKDRDVIVIGGLIAAGYYLMQSGSLGSSVDSPDGVDIVGDALGTVGGLVSFSATTYSTAATSLVQQCEGCSLTAYPDANGYSIGWGHFGATPGQTISQATADAWLSSDLTKAANTVNNLVNVDLTQNQFDALTSFCFNVGGANFGGSTLLKKVNAGDFAGASAEFGRWVYSKGIVIPALETRRTLEAGLFNTPGASASPDSTSAPDPLGLLNASNGIGEGPLDGTSADGTVYA